MRKATLLVAVVVAMAACSEAASPTTSIPGSTSTIPKLGSPPAAVQAALSTVDSCDELLDHFRREALERVGPWGLDGYGGYYPWPMPAGEFFRDTVATEAPAADGGRLQGVDYSGTNVQERGVDEPDIVKTDGRLIYAIVNNEELYYEDYGGYGSGAVLVAIDVAGPEVVGRLNLRRGWGHEMFLVGDTVFVISNGSRPSAAVDVAPNVWEGDYFVPQVGVTLISEIDVSDPNDMAVTRDLYFDGSYVTGRLADGTARIVVRTQPTGLEFVQPKGSGLRAERDAERENRRVIEDSTIDNWLPYYVLEDQEDGSTTEGTLLECGDVYLPDESAGLGLTAVLTVGDGLEVGSAAAVFAQGETVYASTDNLYVATNPWVEPALLEGADWERAAKDFGTTIHRFDIGDPDSLRYEGSGIVTGYLLNQFAMSEHEGFLRVATTDAAARWGFSSDQESFVSVLDVASMEMVGSVGDLGRGEQIYSVRFIGPVGYVVTFRQVDPLYAVDLSDPFHPEVRGELKIPGYSAYLHPVGDGRLLGVGQDATGDGRILGTQVSLFDISNLDDPRLLAKVTLGGDGGSSEVEYDHRAFLYWAPQELAVLPVQVWSYGERGDSYFNGAVGIHVHGDDVHVLDRVSHQPRGDHWDYRGQIRRSIVIGDELYTISDVGVLVSATDDLHEVGWLGF